MLETCTSTVPGASIADYFPYAIAWHFLQNGRTSYTSPQLSCHEPTALRGENTGVHYGEGLCFGKYSRKTKPVIAMRAGARRSSLRRTPLTCRSCCPNVRTVHITGIRPTRGAKLDFDVRLMRSRSSARERTIANG